MDEFSLLVCLSLMEIKWPPSWRLHAGGSYLTLIHSPQWCQKDVPNSLLVLQVWAEMPRAQERFSLSYRLGCMPRSDVFLVSCLSSLWSLTPLKLLKDEVKPKDNMWLLLLTSATCSQFIPIVATYQTPLSHPVHCMLSALWAFAHNRNWHFLRPVMNQTW